MSEESKKPGALEYSVWTENNRLHYEIIIMRENEKKLVSEFSEYKREAEKQRDALRAENDRLRNELSGKTGELEKCKNGIAFYIEAGKVLSYEIKSLKKDISDIRTKFLESQRVVGELTAEVARLKAALEKLSVKENYYIINDHGMVYIGGDYKIYYTETAGQDDYHHPADIARAALAESEPKP